METKRIVRKALVAVLVLCVLAQAELIYIAIEAEVSYISDPSDHLEGNISVGSIISGYYCYESTTLDSDLSLDGGEYLWGISPYGIYLTGGGVNFHTNQENVDFAIGILNNSLGRDSYVVGSHENLPLQNGTTVNNIFWQLEDSTMTAFSSDLLPKTAPVLSDFDDNRLDIEGGTPCEPGEYEFFISSHVTSAIVAPEPMTIMLLSFGALILRKRNL